MRRRNTRTAANSFEPLESRRLLSIAPLGTASVVAGSTPVEAFDVAVAGNGNSIVVSRVGDASQSIVAVRYDASGNQLGAPITLSSGLSRATLSVPGEPVSVSMDAQGDAVVGWSQLQSGTRSSFFVRISKTGVVGTPVAVAGAPVVSMDAAGGFFVAWGEELTQPSRIALEVRAYDASGTALGAAFTVASEPIVINSGDINKIQIAAKPDGSGAVFTAVETSESALDVLLFGRVSTTALIGTLGHIDDSDGKGLADPEIAINADGSFEIEYQKFDLLGGVGGDPANTQLDVQRFDSSGSTVGVPIVVLAVLAGEGVMGSIAAMADGGFITAYGRTVDDPATQSNPVLVQRFDASGAGDPDGPVQVADHLVGAAPAVGVDANGTAIVAFAGGDSDLSVNTARVATADLAFVQNGILYTFGTSADDNIDISVSGSNIVVTRGADTKSFAASTVNVLDVNGSGGDDTITNETNLKSTLRGNEGNDTIFGGSNDDRIMGGVGDDSLWGNDGQDRIYGDDGKDSLYGNGGNDRLEGGAQADFMRGNGGRDHMFGNGGNDRMYGGESGDWIYGQPGNDLIMGEGGNDHLYGDDGSGDDTLSGGAGDDWLVSRDGAIDHLNGDGGHDSADSDSIDVLLSVESAF